jgi:hypothetical protein
LVRPLEDLVDEREPGLPVVRDWIAAASNPVEILPCARADGERTLLALQVSTRSPLGAIAYGTGGLFVDRGWLRILGAGCPRLRRGLADWNGPGGGAPRLAGAMLVADDAVGGFFAVNGGALAGPPGSVFYLAPDTLAWEDLGRSYSEWLCWTFTGDLARFYENARWPTWADEVAGLDGDRAISIYPFLCAKGPPLAARSRRAVPVEELWRLALELQAKLGPA